MVEISKRQVDGETWEMIQKLLDAQSATLGVVLSYLEAAIPQGQQFHTVKRLIIREFHQQLKVKTIGIFQETKCQVGAKPHATIRRDRGPDDA